MAGDWIKMRTDLYRDPKVICIAESLWDEEGPLAGTINQMFQRDMTVTLNVLRNVTVGALVSVWGVARHQGKREGDDLVLSKVGLRVLDDIADVPGFGQAMHDVGWVVETEDGLCFPKFFEEHNADPSDRQKQKNRERQERYRQRHSNVTDNVIVTPRVEKSREENKRERVRTPKACAIPTLEEVREYVKELGYSMDPEKFWHHFEANGWRTKTGPVRAWKSCVVTWQKNEREFANNGKPAPPAADKPWFAIPAERFAALEKAGRFTETHRSQKKPHHIRGTLDDGMRYECLLYPPEPTHA
jgi:hypothetical protein